MTETLKYFALRGIPVRLKSGHKAYFLYQDSDEQHIFAILNIPEGYYGSVQVVDLDDIECLWEDEKSGNFSSIEEILQTGKVMLDGGICYVSQSKFRSDALVAEFQDTTVEFYTEDYILSNARALNKPFNLTKALAGGQFKLKQSEDRAWIVGKTRHQTIEEKWIIQYTSGTLARFELSELQEWFEMV